MSRRAQAPVRSILPDPKFNNEMLAKFMNVIIGHLIPAGTGMPGYRQLRLEAEKQQAAVEEVVVEDEGAKTA